MNTCKQLLEAMAQVMKEHPQGKFYRYLLEHGTEFTGFIPSKIPKARRKVKECHKNCQLLVLFEHKDWEYWEGYSCPTDKDGTTLIPVEHSWLVHESVVIDPTFEPRNKSAEYFGIRIPTSFVASHVAKTERAEQLLWRYIDTVVNPED